MLSHILPSPRLRPYISHYWASRNNHQAAHTILPDGSVDLVFAADEAATYCWLFGTSTSATEVPLMAGTTYLGVRFRPGQARHFTSLAAKELTDQYAAASEVLRFSLEGVPEQVTTTQIFGRLNELLEKFLVRSQPEQQRIDLVIRWIERQAGNVRIEDAAGMYGRSRRQLERTFVDVVGISPKLFASIVRFQNAASRMSRPNMTLTEVALASGYTDQSHMTNEFRRLAGTSPARFLAGHVAFLQDAAERPVQNEVIPI